MVELFSLNINSDLAIKKYDYYKKFLSTKKRIHIERYHCEEDRRRSLYGEIIIRKLISDKLKLNLSEIVFKTNEFGKPYLDGFPEFHFNISHSGTWVIVGIGYKELGLDIEQIEENNNSVAKRFFTEKEYNTLRRLQEKDRADYFYTLWTLKESYIKCIGKGLSIPLNSFSFEVEDDEVILFPSNDNYYFRRFESLSGYKVAVCSKEQINNKIEEFSPLKILFND